MSHSISGTNISLTRGDSLFLEIGLTEDGEEYTPEEGSSLRFALKESYEAADSTALVKEIPIDTCILEIKPEDTKPLTMKKTYVYDIQFTDADGHVDTVIKGKFKITEEVL